MALMPKRVKHRKEQRGRVKGNATRGNTVAFGDWGLQTLETGRIRGTTIEACRIAVETDGSDAVVLGCAGMADLCRHISSEIGVPVVDGVAAGTLFVQSLVTLGLGTGKRGEFATPPPKLYTGMLDGFSRA